MRDRVHPDFVVDGDRRTAGKMLHGDLRRRWRPAPGGFVCAASAGMSVHSRIPSSVSGIRSSGEYVRRFDSRFLIKLARLAQSVERKTLNLVVVGSSPTVGAFLLYISKSKYLTAG